MTDDRSLERAARSWIDVGPTRAPERAVERALQLIQATPQERDLPILRRFQTMPLSVRFATAAVIGVLAVGAIYALWRPGSNVAVPGPTLIPTAAPSATASASALVAPPSPHDYSSMAGRILLEHLGNAIDGSEAPATDNHPERRRFYFMDPATMSGTTAVEFLPGKPTTGKTAADVSRDGRKVVFQDFAEKARLYVANLDGSGFRKLPIDCDCSLLYPAFDPTASRIVYVRVQGAESWLEIFDLATTKITKLNATVSTSRDDVPEQPSWSPDGTRIVYTSLTWNGEQPVVGTIHYGNVPPSDGHMYILGLLPNGTTGTTVLGNLGPLPGDARWSPDGTKIIFTSGPASTTGSNAGMPEGGGTRRLDLETDAVETLPGWGGPEYLPDGQFILVQDDGYLKLMRPDGSGLAPVNANALRLAETDTGFGYIGHWIPNP